MKKYLVPVLIAVVLVAAIIAAITFIPKIIPEKKITVGIIDTTVSVCYPTEDGEWTGIQCDLIKKVADEIGYKVEFKEIIWTERNKLLTNGEIDCYVSSGDTERNVLATKPLVYSIQAVVCQKDISMAFTPEIHFKNFSCGVQEGSINHEYLTEQQASDIKFYGSVPEIITALKNKTCQMGIIDYAVYLTYIENNSEFDNLTSTIFTDAYDYSLCFNTDENKVVEKLNNGIEKLMENGVIKETIEKYDTEHKNPFMIY